MPVSFEMIPIPIGSQYVRTIGSNDRDDLNDFPVLIIADENVVLEPSDLSVSSGSSIVSFRGSKSVYEAVIRPPETAGILTVSIGANAVPEGNPAVSQDIRISTSFPDVDAEVPTRVFDSGSGHKAIAVSDTHIYTHSGFVLKTWTHAGVETNSLSVLGVNFGSNIPMDYFNGTFIYAGGRRYNLEDFSEIERYSIPLLSAGTHTRLGILAYNHTANPDHFYIQPYGTTESNDRIAIALPDTFPSTFTAWYAIAHQADLLFLAYEAAGRSAALAEITDDDNIRFIKRLNIARTNASNQIFTDIAIYQDTLFLVVGSGATADRGVHILDIRKYRPLAKNTKTTIPVQFANSRRQNPSDAVCP